MTKSGKQCHCGINTLGRGGCGLKVWKLVRRADKDLLNNLPQTQGQVGVDGPGKETQDVGYVHS